MARKPAYLTGWVQSVGSAWLSEVAEWLGKSGEEEARLEGSWRSGSGLPRRGGMSAWRVSWLSDLRARASEATAEAVASGTAGGSWSGGSASRGLASRDSAPGGSEPDGFRSGPWSVGSAPGVAAPGASTGLPVVMVMFQWPRRASRNVEQDGHARRAWRRDGCPGSE